MLSTTPSQPSQPHAGAVGFPVPRKKDPALESGMGGRGGSRLWGSGWGWSKRRVWAGRGEGVKGRRESIRHQPLRVVQGRGGHQEAVL